jgi:hypothetical protein
VALERYGALDDAEVVVHLYVPAGTPGLYLNLFDDTARLPAPTLLLARGRTLAIHTADDRGGKWHLEAEILPGTPTSPTGDQPRA